MKRAFLLSLLLAVIAPAAASADGIRKDTAVEPTSWGRVQGQIYDAATGSPLPGATVVVRDSGTFAQSGRTVGQTDAQGRYQCAGMLGRVSSNLDILRLLNTGLIGLVIGGATNQTKRVDVTRLPLRVQCDGYAPFEGVVRCKSVSPGRFSVTMEPILMARADSGERSTATEGWGVVRIADVSVDPPVARPGDRVKITAHVHSPTMSRPGDLRVECESPDIVHRKGLKPEGTASPDGVFAYSETIGIPRSAKPKVETVEVYVDRSPYDLAAPGSILTEFHHAGTVQERMDMAEGDRTALQTAVLHQSALIQIVTDDAQAASARERSAAYALLQQEQNVEAAEKLRALAAAPKPELWDLYQVAEVSEKLHDSGEAVDALKKAADIAPPKDRMRAMGLYARALVAAGHGDRAIAECMPLVRRVKDKDRSQTVPVPLLVALGNACVQTKDFKEADSINETLLKSEMAPLYPPVADFRTSLRLAEAQNKADSDPKSADARAAYGRVLMDVGRWEEAASELRTAVDADPHQAAVRRDLAYAVLHLKGGSDSTHEDLDKALADAEQQVQLPEGRKVGKTKDFFAWHTLALLRYEKALRQQAEGDSGTTTLAACRDAIKEALKCGRQGASVNDGLFLPFVGYANPSLVAISGFAYPEANCDFSMLESLRALERNPEDYLAAYDLGTALIELHRPDLAGNAMRKALDLRPDFPDAQYGLALIALDSGDRRQAESRLATVIKQNPRHPQANLMLARMHAEDGDTAAAAASLAAHAKVYGYAR